MARDITLFGREGSGISMYSPFSRPARKSESLCSPPLLAPHPRLQVLTPMCRTSQKHRTAGGTWARQRTVTNTGNVGNGGAPARHCKTRS
jgi:hypothetical protein